MGKRVIDDATLTALADSIRSKTGSAEPLVFPEDFSAGLDAVFAAGSQSEYDFFWDTLQQNGTRVSYACAFGGWVDALFQPKYDICPTDGYMMFRSTSIKDLKHLPVKLDFSRTSNTQYMFQWAITQQLGELDLRSMSNQCDNMFAYTYYLHTIDKLILKDDGNQILKDNMFTEATALQNITIEGVIGKKFSFKWSTKLSKASIGSIVNALSTATSGLSLTLSLTAVNNAFSNEEWATLANTRPNWTINLV
jgi:hypothetical protein